MCVGLRRWVSARRGRVGKGTAGGVARPSTAWRWRRRCNWGPGRRLAWLEGDPEGWMDGQAGDARVSKVKLRNVDSLLEGGAGE